MAFLRGCSNGKAAFEDGNPDYGDGQEKFDAVIADLLLIQELDKNPRVPKDVARFQLYRQDRNGMCYKLQELYRYNVLPEELTALGPRVRELGDDLYEALGLSSMDRRSFVQMKLKHQAHHPIARTLLEKINKNMEKLETIPLEMERIKDRPVIHLKEYLFKEPELLLKPKDPKKRKIKR
ncbi:hypothetical protein TRIUR3_31146 [Triticum urartu]|uniref:Uncharacterized protein n=1 Tax=Triticum urartu TaxID=4572 RepID=M7ZD92_TRIUA|nr:hypothetical protein TRIUR3_31146 [Triticum urartu]